MHARMHSPHLTKVLTAALSPDYLSATLAKYMTVILMNLIKAMMNDPKAREPKCLKQNANPRLTSALLS